MLFLIPQKDDEKMMNLAIICLVTFLKVLADKGAAALLQQVEELVVALLGDPIFEKLLRYLTCVSVRRCYLHLGVKNLPAKWAGESGKKGRGARATQGVGMASQGGSPRHIFFFVAWLHNTQGRSSSSAGKLQRRQRRLAARKSQSRTARS